MYRPHHSRRRLVTVPLETSSGSCVTFGIGSALGLDMPIVPSASTPSFRTTLVRPAPGAAR